MLPLYNSAQPEGLKGKFPVLNFFPGRLMYPIAVKVGAYCLIIGTPPNAIVYASGFLEPKDYLRVGIPVWIIANILLLAMTGLYWILRGFGELPGF